MQVASAISRSFPVRAAIAVFTVLPAFAAAGCFTDTDGLDPPKSQLYYPTNLVVSPGGKALYVTNSDFDIQYNGGTVQVLDLTTLRETAVALREDLHAATQEALKAIAEGKEPDTRATEAVCARVNNHGAPLAKNP